MKKVLILEDEVNIRSFVVINLQRAGYDTIEAGTGAEALEQLRQNPDIGVAILDIMLPDIDGFEVCRNIRATNKQIGIIMLTARTQEMDKVTGLMTGADDYVTKPFSPAELTARVDASFILEQLEYMKKSGRCSAVALLGANLLKLRPCIEVKDGKMGVAKKYRGTFAKCLEAYIADRLAGRDDIELGRIFITHSGVPDEIIALAKSCIAKYQTFDEVCVTRAGCTVSSHCGPGTIGILFIRK